jgi:cell wall-associated NlpC family hydrolase
MPLDDYLDRFCAFALSQAAIGAHYVWGATGAVPDGTGGTIRRPGSVSLEPPRLQPASPSVFAALCAVDGRHVCAGRYQEINGGRPANAGDADLVAYLLSLQLMPQATWLPFFIHFSPRVTDGGTIVWGEDCRGRPHFDCVGLINWAAEQAVESRYAITFEIRQWAENLSGTVAVPLADPFRRGDILIRSSAAKPFEHIALLASDPATGFQGVVEAASTERGVVRTAGYDPNRWAFRRRPTAVLFRD